MTKVKLLGVLLAGLVAGPVAAEDSFLCVAEKATGFNFKGGEWVSVNFKANEKYIVRKVSESSSAYEVVEMGDEIYTSYCENGIGAFGLICSGAVKFTMMKSTLRYTLSSHGSYNANFKKGGDSVYIEIGKCVRM